ncbi:hypothetical protein EV421DRAFT_1842492 [Armillaria borealis]|uniref:F-box domain-containing protein n=1 Tax=Armillaria borealis TaxID=47425 RepID=A0AA39J0H9_9AGAR|nr:hypothetical protein EV421DRAFT_1842492 [Armillaria borealis]
MNSALYDLPDDVLIYNIKFLSVPDVLRLRKTCQRFNALTRLPIVWTNAFKLDILAKDYPFDAHDIDIEHRTRQAYRLASRWLADSPLTPKVETIFIGSPAYVIKFVPGHKWLLTLSNGSSSALSIWDITCRQKCSEWPSKSTMFTGMTINTERQSEANVAASLVSIPSLLRRIVLLHLDDNGILHEIQTIDKNLRPVTLTGDIVALSDDISKIVIYNWKTDECAYLDDGSGPNRNHYYEVVFTPLTILVVSISSTNLYIRPSLLHGQTLTPVASHSFSRAYGASVPTPASNNPLSILVRSLSPDNLSTLLKLYTLSSFPPILTSDISYRCGTFKNTGFMLGKSATAVWIHPNEHDGSQTLAAAVYPGPLNPTAEVRVRDVCSNPLNNWGTLDYDEEIGRIVLGSTSGKDITVIQL